MMEAKDRETWRAVVREPSFLADKGPTVVKGKAHNRKKNNNIKRYICLMNHELTT